MKIYNCTLKYIICLCLKRLCFFKHKQIIYFSPHQRHSMLSLAITWNVSDVLSLKVKCLNNHFQCYNMRILKNI